MTRVSLGVLLVVAMASTARAGGERAAVKGHVECYVYTPAEDGADQFTAAKRIRDKKKVTIPVGSELACRFVIDKGTAPDDASVMFAVWQGGQVLDTPEGHQLVTDAGPAYVALDQPLERGRQFGPCAPFRVTGSLKGGGEVLASGAVSVTPKCPKPKKEKATLDCTSQSVDGEILTWPGNGAKLAASLEDRVDCQVEVAAPRGDVARYTVVPSTGAGTSLPTTLAERSGRWVATFAIDPGDQFETCRTFTLKVRMANADDQTVWTGKVKFVQRCAE